MLKELVMRKTKKTAKLTTCFKLGKMSYDGTVELYNDSVAIKVGNKTLLFMNQDMLQEYKTKKHANEKYFSYNRNKGKGELYISETMPYPKVGDQYIVVCIIEDQQKIDKLLEEHPQDTIIPYETRHGDYVALLQVTYK